MQKGFFLTAFSIVFLDLLGVSIIIPILAPLFLDGGIIPGSFAMQTITLGLLIACYPIAQFFGSPILGALSDKHGRKPLLAISLIGTFIGYVLFALGIIYQHLWLLFAGRLIDGFTGGNISVVFSAIADVTTQKDKAANFGMIGMAFGLGFIIGPFIGGKLSDPNLVSWFTFATPIWFAAILSLINLCFVWFLFKETIRMRRKTPVSLLTGFKNIRLSFHMKNLRTLFIVVFLNAFAFTFFTAFSQVFYIQKFAFTQGDIGNLFAFTGLCIALTQGVIVRYVTRWISIERTVTISLPLMALSLFLILLAPTVFWLYVVTAFLSLWAGLAHPTLSAVVSNQAGAESQGEIMGINQSINAAAMAIPAIIAGIIVNIHMNLPILLSGTVMIITWIAFIIFMRAPKETFHEV